MAYDVSMIGRDQFLTMINDQFNSSLSTNNVSLSTRVDNNTGTAGDSSITLTALPNTGLSGTRTVNYNRISLQEFLDDTPIGTVILDADAYANDPKATVLEAFNNFYLSQVQDGDIDDTSTFPTELSATETGTVILRASATSVAYQASCTIYVKAADTPLNEIITNQNLDGLFFYAAPAPDPDPVY